MDYVTGVEKWIVFGVREKTETVANFVKYGAGEIVSTSSEFSIDVEVPECVGVKTSNYVRFCRS